MDVEVKIFSIFNEGQIPVYATEGSAAFDIRTTHDVNFAGVYESWLVQTGIKVAIPDGYEIQIRPRSSLGMKGITIPNSPGTIDSDYRGEIMVPLVALTGEEIIIKKGDRIAQGVLAPVCRAKFVRVEKEEELGETKRGSGGFGSTGK